MHSFLQLVLGLVAFDNAAAFSFNGSKAHVRVRRDELPSEVDWRKEGFVTPVQNQGTLDAGWAFSVTGALEGRHFGGKEDLSEQQLVDCATEPGPVVPGFSRKTAFDYIIQNEGIAKEASYPYEGKKGACRFTPGTAIGAKCTGYVVVHPTEAALQEVVAEMGPVSVFIDASLDSFAKYTDGVYDDPKCDNTVAGGNHAVLVVGYGETKLKRTKYWIVKNSRGPEWGDKGYIRMSRDKNNQCGIANSPMYVIQTI